MSWLAHAVSTYVLHAQHGNGYQWWSGAGSDLGEAAIIGGLISIARHHNCHAKGCPRLGRHPVEGTPYRVCRRHHPAIDGAPTAESIAVAYAAARQGTET